MEDRNQPATKQDLLDLENRFENRFVELENRFVEALHDTETKLLRAFYGWAEATQKHFADLERSDISLRERIDTCERRITELERKVDFPGR